VAWKRVIDGDTIEAILPSGRTVNIRIEGYDAPEIKIIPDGPAAKQGLESLLEATADQELTVFVPLPVDADKNGRVDFDELLRAISFERVRAYMFTGSVRIDRWMIEHGYRAE